MNRARAMGIRGRAPKTHPLYGLRATFETRDGAIWQVHCDSTGYFYASADGCQLTSTAYEYAFSVQGALLKALAEEASTST